MLRLDTLGRLELTQDRSTILSGRRKLLTVLAYLLRENGRTVSRARLADLFWPVEDEVRSRRSVRQALTELRRAVGEGLHERDEGIAIVPETIALDAAELEHAAAAGQFEAAVELWQGDFLAGMEDSAGEELRSWLEPERQALRARFAHAAEQLIEAAERKAAWEAGLTVARKWVAALPYDERATSRQRRLLLLAGRLSDTGGAPSQSPAIKGLLSPDLVGREAEFARLTGLWREVRGGAAGVVLIEGEDGSGKTRLTEEFLRWARQQDPQPVVLQARAFEMEQARPGVLLRHLLAALATAPGLGAAPAATLRSLGALVPEIAERFPALTSEATTPTTTEAVSRALTEVAAERAIVLAVDDANLADSASREVLAALCRHPAAGVLVLLAASEGLFPELAHVERRGGRMDGSFLRLRLAPLSEAELELLLRGMADFVAADCAALSTRLHAESAGNPLVAVELVTALADAGHIAPRNDGHWILTRSLDQQPLPVPVSIRNAAALRLRQLPSDTARVLQAAAVLGRETDLALLREVAGLDMARLDAALDQLIGRRFLRLPGDGPIRVEFVHEMVRQVVYQELPPTLRQQLHGGAWRGLRRGGARDGARREAIAHHRARMSRMASRRTGWLVAAGLLLVLGAGAAALLTDRNHPAVLPNTVAVLPFNGRDESPHGYLREGMVTLLGAALDGLGGLTSTDAQRVLALPPGQRIDPKQGRTAAARVGAGLFVLGELIETEGRIELEATLYDSRGRRRTVARSAAANEAGVYAAVDELAKQFVLGRGGPSEITRAAATTTASLPALKAYLAGERHLRAGDFGPAVEAFQAAVTLDTAFALAYYRLAIAAEWDMQGDVLSELAARKAAHFSERLSPRTRTMVQGLFAWRSGDYHLAELEYNKIVTRYPQDVEAWFQLAEVLFHSGPVQGMPVRSSKAAWLEVLRLEPDNRFALLHLARIAGSEGDSAAIRELVPRRPELFPDVDRRLLELAAWRAVLLRSKGELAQVTAAMQRWVPSTAAIWQLASYSRDIPAVERLVRFQLVRWGQDVLLTPHLALAQGGWARADSLLASSGLPARAYAAALPFVALPREQVLRIRDTVRVWRPAAIPAAETGASTHRLTGLVVQRYLLGALHVRLDDLAAADADAAALERLDPQASPQSLQRDLTLGLKAMIARAKGQPQKALQFLDSTRSLATPEEIFASPFHSRALERWHRAELLKELGRGEEALRWFESMAQLSPSELVYLAPAYQRRAEIQEELGRGAEAASLYARFIELWGNADPQSQPMVTQARVRLARLQGPS